MCNAKAPFRAPFKFLFFRFFNHAVRANALAAASFHRVGIHYLGFGVIVLRHSGRTVHGANETSQTFIFINLIFCHMFLLFPYDFDFISILKLTQVPV
jgi:hypothetical protein